MKKLFVASLIAALAFSPAAQADLEIAGNVTTVTAYQHDSSTAAGHGAGGLTQGVGSAIGGDFAIADVAGSDHFRFLVDQVEIDLESEFGENIRARADIDFRDIAGTNVRGVGDFVALEQGYVTANINVGNGLEFLVGKFNAPLHIEDNDRNKNVFSTYTPGYIYLNPKNLIGMKLYYEFNENWNMDFAITNNLNGAIAGTSALPSGLFRLGVYWGDEGNESYINLAFGFGPETASNSDFDYLTQLWGNWALGDYWDVGWSLTGRMSTPTTGVGAYQKAIAGQLYAVWQVSDAWSLQLRGAAFWEINPAAARGGSGASTRPGGTWSGFEGVTYSGTLGTTYNITDGANLKLEYRFDYAATAGAAANPSYHTGVAEFAYSF